MNGGQLRALDRQYSTAQPAVAWSGLAGLLARLLAQLRLVCALWCGAILAWPALGTAFAAEEDGVPAGNSSLRFFGNGVADIDRVKIRIDDPANSDPGPPADVGATDFTLEFWMRASAAENAAAAVSCGANINWIYGNIVMDRDRYAQDRKFGLSLAGGVPVWGVSGDGTGDRTICGATDVLDDEWHHVAVQRRRSDGWMWLFVDGALEAEGDGPDGDVSYPDDGVPGDFCGGPCTNSDPFLVFGAEKHDAGPEFPSYSGYLDEIRVSNVIRYTTPFLVLPFPFVADANTVALYHLDEGAGDFIGDTSGAADGPSHGERRFGGSPAGPIWTSESPLMDPPSGVDEEGPEPGAPGSDLLDARASNARLDVQPHPVGNRGRVGLQFRLAPGSVQRESEWDAPPNLLLFDSSGRLLRVVEASVLVPDGADFDLTLPEHWPAGVYLARVTAVWQNRPIEASTKLIRR